MLRFCRGELLSNAFPLMAHRLCPRRGVQIEIKIKILRRSRSNLPRSYDFCAKTGRGENEFIREVHALDSDPGSLACRSPSAADTALLTGFGGHSQFCSSGAP